MHHHNADKCLSLHNVTECGNIAPTKQIPFHTKPKDTKYKKKRNMATKCANDPKYQVNLKPIFQFTIITKDNRTLPNILTFELQALMSITC